MRWRRWLTAVAGSLSVAVFIGLSAAGGWFYWERVQIRGEESARAVLPHQAADDIPKVFAYDYQTVERSLAAAYPLLTPDYRQGVPAERQRADHSGGQEARGGRAGQRRRRGSHYRQT